MSKSFAIPDATTMAMQIVDSAQRSVLPPLNKAIYSESMSPSTLDSGTDTRLVK